MTRITKIKVPISFVSIRGSIFYERKAIRPAGLPHLRRRYFARICQQVRDKEIIEGVLTCKKCTHEYKVVRGVPRFVDLSKIEADKAETAENFGWQWTNFTQEDQNTTNSFSAGCSP